VFTEPGGEHDAVGAAGRLYDVGVHSSLERGTGPGQAEGTRAGRPRPQDPEARDPSDFARFFFFFCYAPSRVSTARREPNRHRCLSPV